MHHEDHQPRQHDRDVNDSVICTARDNLNVRVDWAGWVGDRSRDLLREGHMPGNHDGNVNNANELEQLLPLQPD